MFTVSCPNCSATYQLDETKVGPQGRKLKCARCGHIWVAMPPVAVVMPQVVPEAGPVPEAASQPAPQAVAVQSESPVAPTSVETPAVPVVEETVVHLPAPQVEVEALVKVRRYPWSRALVGERKWRTFGILICLLGMGGAVWVATVKMLPRQHAKAAVEVAPAGVSATVPVVIPPPQGVVLQRVRAQFTQVGEGVVLSVQGTMKNTSETAVDLPHLRVELLGKDGKVQDMWPVNLVSTTLLPAVEMPWGVSFTNPDVKNIAGWRAVFVE